TGHIRVVAEANDAADMLRQLMHTEVEVLLTDIAMPGAIDGLGLSLQLLQTHPQIRILALSMSEDGHLIERMMDEAQVNGFVPKTAGRQELVQAIETIARGGHYFAPSVLQQYQQYKRLKRQNHALHLSHRELEIISCVLKHYSNKQIGQALDITERTVETHRKNIYRKTNTRGEAELIAFVKEHKLLG
ncbi:MAG TPA: response regulator transcription factor, partial [Phnomibacter sp.]|nr:response regulator transcription factor [Phnomibacter sp.]